MSVTNSHSDCRQGTYCTSLGQLAREIYPFTDDAKYLAQSHLMCSQPHKLALTTQRNLLTIRVCIQNRRKDNAAVLVFSSRAQVITRACATDDVLRGKVDAYDNVATFTRDG